jgi:hypothetical protein
MGKLTTLQLAALRVIAATELYGDSGAFFSGPVLRGLEARGFVTSELLASGATCWKVTADGAHRLAEYDAKGGAT